MRRCIEIASRAEGMTYPNPLVGSVIVHEGRITGEGFHLKAGMAHAEVIAINNVKDRSTLSRSTLYVNLEPCSHFGKTPPCSDFIIANGIPRVIIGTIDTSEKVGGRGVAKLKSSGCEVVTGVLEKQCRWLNRRFFTYNEKKRPYIILKWAQSADGFIDIMRKSKIKPGPTWISGKPERVLVHKWRAAEQSILVGAGTMRADNPKLNVREWKGNDPLRIILSSSGRFNIEEADNQNFGPVIVFTNNKHFSKPGTKVVLLNDNDPSSIQICSYLYQEGIQSLFIEGGSMVLNHFIDCGMWDEARVFKSSVVFNEGIKAPQTDRPPDSTRVFTGSKLETYINDTD